MKEDCPHTPLGSSGLVTDSKSIVTALGALLSEEGIANSVCRPFTLLSYLFSIHMRPDIRQAVAENSSNYEFPFFNCDNVYWIQLFLQLLAFKPTSLVSNKTLGQNEAYRFLSLSSSANTVFRSKMNTSSVTKRHKDTVQIKTKNRTVFHFLPQRAEPARYAADK